MIGPVLDFDDLRRISRLGKNAQLATVERWAKQIGLRYNYDAKGGIWTTEKALNAAVGFHGLEENGKYSREMIV